MTDTGYTLIDRPPASRQYGERHMEQTGCLTIHTSEGIYDTRPPDNGAENVDNFIHTRSQPGSYHEIVDSDTFVTCLPDHLRAFHVAAPDVNQFAWGIAVATRAADWGKFPLWDASALRIAGTRCAAYAVRWASRQPGSLTRAYECARWITADQAYRGDPGLIHHGQFQLDRSDAWEHNPLRPILDGTLRANMISSLHALLIPPSAHDDGEQPMKVLVHDAKKFLQYPDGLIIEHRGSNPPDTEEWEPSDFTWNKMVVVNRKRRVFLDLDPDEIKA
jgi:hypothetical protein